MASVASMYEEKLSPKLEDPYKRSEDCFESEKLLNKSDADAVLDEMAAKANTSNFDALPEDSDDVHLNCESTLEDQRDTVEILINQLRYMSEEYEEAYQEREYYEELNEALLLCLELKEGKIEVEDSDDEEDIRNLNCNINDGPRIAMTPIEEANKTKQQKEMSKKGEGMNVEGEEPSDEKSTKEKLSELRLNDLLLSEIFKLRDESELLKENFLEYIEDGLSQSTGTEDNEEHVCGAECGLNDDDSEDTEDYGADNVM